MSAVSTSAVSTPCIRVCVIDPTRGVCEGCGRTLAEIAAWGGMSEAERLAVMARLADAQAGHVAVTTILLHGDDQSERDRR